MTANRPRRSLSTSLARWVGLTTAFSLTVFAGAAAAVLQFAEEREAREAPHSGPAIEPFDEALEEVGTAMLVAAPIGILLAIVSAQWLTRRAVARVVDVSAKATRMTAEQLSERLPVSPRGDELDALAVALNGLFARLEDGVALQRQFAADASHELRSPLAVLSSTLEVARRRPRSSEEWEAVADGALREVQHMTRLVESLLQLARAGTLPRTTPITARALVEAVFARLAALAASTRIQLKSDIPDDIAVQVDCELVTVALGNIVANAIAHSPPGGSVRVGAIAEAEYVHIRVSDEGPGVPPGERERIFHPFVRGAAATADRGGSRIGLGLGLAIARRVVEGHHGHILVEDRPGGGAVFSVNLPRVALPT
ncbi:MAG: HAMP domain-containing histidine kinase [Nannocystis sp.]|uniref:sensor histidine kinase n=1 Tax=Nannocystis sp. TaxID=1962667 RepID=UPI0024242652|nr:HAMP domain-containing sensor histidine kinase [Nannocystis sp.]MBK9756242.1 HAMP domain-containing histidine kinase [Nannocystis sp.]